jgi:Flp pilus assembly protein TadB
VQKGDPARRDLQDHGRRSTRGGPEMRHLRRAAVTAVVGILLIIVLATALQPLLPWLFVLIIFCCIIRLALRS